MTLLLGRQQETTQQRVEKHQTEPQILRIIDVIGICQIRSLSLITEKYPNHRYGVALILRKEIKKYVLYLSLLNSAMLLELQSQTGTKHIL